MGHSNQIELIARGFIVSHGKVLLCQSVKHGYYYLPGGHIEFGEHAQVALQREFVEETGLESSIGELVLSSEHRFNDGKSEHHEINLVFLVEQLGRIRSDWNRSKAESSSDQEAPTHVESMESKIRFEWVDLGMIVSADVRPVEMKAWLMSGGVIDPNQGRWMSGFEPRN